MKIVMTVPDLKLSSGGPSSSVISLTYAVAGCGENPVIYFMDDGDEIINTPHNNNVDVRLIPFKNNRVSKLLTILNIKRKISNELLAHSDLIVHDHGIWTLFNKEIIRTCIDRKIPYMISPHGMLEPWALQFKKYKKDIAWKLYQHNNLKKASVLNTTSYQEAMNIRAIGFKNPIAVIPNIIETVPLMTEQPEQDKQIKTVLFLSRINPKKGLINLIEAWNILRPAHWRLIISGPDQNGHEEYVKSLVSKYKLDSQVNFVGPQYNEHKWRLMQNADLFVLPTFSENFGLVVGEALSMGVPVITTKGAPWSDLETYNCGWWIDIGVEPLVAALRQAFELDDMTRYEMGLRGKKYIEETYQAEKVGKQTISVYEWILGGGDPPPCLLTD